MDRTSTVDEIRDKYRKLSTAFDAKTRRLLAASEAKSAGWRGISMVSEATGLAHTAIRRGVNDLECLAKSPENTSCLHEIRRMGVGRKNVVETNPRICEAFESLIEPGTRGDPVSALKWTCKSTRRLSRELQRQDFSINRTSVRALLHHADYCAGQGGIDTWPEPFAGSYGVGCFFGVVFVLRDLASCSTYPCFREAL